MRKFVTLHFKRMYMIWRSGSFLVSRKVLKQEHNCTVWDCIVGLLFYQKYLKPSLYLNRLFCFRKNTYFTSCLSDNSVEEEKSEMPAGFRERKQQRVEAWYVNEGFSWFLNITFYFVVTTHHIKQYQHFISSFISQSSIIIIIRKMTSVSVATDSAAARTVQETLVFFSIVQVSDNTGYSATVHMVTTSGAVQNYHKVLRFRLKMPKYIVVLKL